MAVYSDIIKGIKSTVAKVLNPDTGAREDVIPNGKDPVKVGDFVTNTWAESKKWYENQFNKTKDVRFLTFSTPQEFWSNALKLESGNHWDVYGHRNTDSDDDWKQEVVDPAIGDQIRARSAYLSANWHDVSIQPNVKGINDILDQERKATSWSKMTRRSVKNMGIFGDVWVKSLLDKSLDSRGVASEVVCRPGSVLMNPFAWGKQKSEGCWYIQHGQMVNEYYVRDAFPDFDLNSVSTVRNAYEKFFTVDENNTDAEYNHTHQYDLIEMNLDDPTLEAKPFDEEEFQRRVVELVRLVSGNGEQSPGIPAEESADQKPIVPDESDNQPRYIKAWQDWLEERIDAGERMKEAGQFTDQDSQFLDQLAGAVEEQVKQHQDFADKAPKWTKNGSRREKYPNGRLIITIGGRVAQDDPNPYEFDWRERFHYISNEEVPERLDGRGDVEILYPTNKAMDQALSRFADGLIIGAHPKPWLPETERATVEKDGYSTNPTKPGYYQQSAPVFPKPAPPIEELTLYDRLKFNIQSRLGITDITFGRSPSKKDSAEKVQTLISQNEVLVTGEANANLNDAIEEIIETRILIWKQFYKEPRMYYIDGRMQWVIVSDLLQFEEVNEDGQTKKRKISKFEISVRPESNFPNKWARDLSILEQFYAMKREDGQTPLIPSKAIMDYIAQRFPQLSADSEYQKELEATKVGLQVMQQQAAQKQQEADFLNAAKKRLQSKALNAVMNGQSQVPSNPQQPQPSNGVMQ